MNKMPDRLYIDKEDRKLYEKIEEEEFFKGKGRKEQFLLAMAIGFKNNVKIPLGTKDGLFLEKDLSTEDKSLIISTAIKDKNSVEVLLNKDEVFKIAEEYAHAGIRILTDKINSIPFGSFEKQFEKELFEAYDSIYSAEEDEKDTSNRT